MVLKIGEHTQFLLQESLVLIHGNKAQNHIVKTLGCMVEDLHG
jgi:hypothetical protein